MWFPAVMVVIKHKQLNLPNSGDNSMEGGGRECLERIFEIQT